MDRERIKKLVGEMTTGFVYDAVPEDDIMAECRRLVYAAVGSAVRLTQYLGVVCSQEVWPVTDDLPFSLLPQAEVVRLLQTGLDEMDPLDCITLVLNPAAMHQIYTLLHSETVDGVAQGWVEAVQAAMLEAMGK